MSINKSSGKTERDLVHEWNEVLISEGLPDIDISEGFGSKIDNVLNGEYYQIEEIKNKLYTITNAAEYTNGTYYYKKYLYDSIPVAEIEYIINNDTVYIEHLMTANSEKKYNILLDKSKKNIWGRKLNLKGLGTYVLEEILNEVIQKGTKKIIFVYTDESEGFHKKVLPKVAKKYDASYSMINNTVVINLH